MIVGGEKFMWVAYGAVWGGMGLYLGSLIRRRRAIESEHRVFKRRMTEGSEPAPSQGEVAQ